MGTRSNGGYGTVRGHGNEPIYAHRYSYELHKGLIPKDGILHVCHTCDNPSCVNPDHLFLGTMSENMKDKIKKGRNPRGEKSGLAVLSEKEVLEIRSIYPALSCKKLGEKYGVNGNTIFDIIKRRTWTHIGGTPEKYPSRPKTHPPLTFTKDQIKVIRDEYALGSSSYQKLAIKYDTSKSVIRDVILKINGYKE